MAHNGSTTAKTFAIGEKFLPPEPRELPEGLRHAAQGDTAFFAGDNRHGAVRRSSAGFPESRDETYRGFFGSEHTDLAHSYRTRSLKTKSSPAADSQSITRGKMKKVHYSAAVTLFGFYPMRWLGTSVVLVRDRFIGLTPLLSTSLQRHSPSRQQAPHAAHFANTSGNRHAPGVLHR